MDMTTGRCRGCRTTGALRKAVRNSDRQEPALWFPAQEQAAQRVLLEASP